MADPSQAEQTPASVIDCALEPIRVPGSVQQHGFFLLTDQDFSRVLVASENAGRYLRIPLKLILGAPLQNLLERELIGAIRLQRVNEEKNPEGLVSYLGTFHLHGELFSVVTHCIGGQHALEFEVQERIVGPEMMNAVITNFVSTLGRLASERELCEELSRQFAELTGFDRVLLYNFDDEGHGTVLAEVNNGKLPSYLDLRFPASDIPPQARELYVLNTVRIIPDAQYKPSMLAGVSDIPARSLDLSRATLRSVSPIHLEYMRNMGTLSSMSVSILKEGRLWGLVSGHHATPKSVPYLVRSACDMLTRMASTQLAAFHTAARLQQMVHFHAVQREALTVMASAPNYLQGLVDHLDMLREITRADGAALVVEGRISCSGKLPREPFLRELLDWLDRKPEFEVFHSSNLGADFPPAEKVREDASGLLAIRISAVQQRYIVWFRPELVSTVRWAGEPAKVVDGLRLHPRDSFDEWKEIVRGHSEPWSSMEVDSAREFRFALTTIGLRRAEEALQEGEARFQQLTHALPLKIFLVDDRGQLAYVNQRWRSEGLDVLGRWYEHAGLSSQDAKRAEQLWDDAVRSGQAFEAELCIQSSPEVPEQPNLVRVVPFHRMGGERAGWIGVFIDLTESKQREMALRMTEKLALTGRMTSVIAHEINNPLEAITNLMYLLRMDLEEQNPEATQYITMAESELERISWITKQTLRWNRENTEAATGITASSLVDDVLRLFVGKIRNRQISTRIEGATEVQFRGVIGQVRQVLANLVSNAIDASPMNSPLTIGVEERPGELGLSVHDTGKGIPEATQSRLFEPFFSTKGDLGNGLGLYISREIMERHGGRIEVDSTPGNGTTMTMWLPR